MKLVVPTAVLLTSFAALAAADEIVVPDNAPTTAGSGGYSTLLRSMPRSYQLVVGGQELTGMPAGSMLTGIAWRRPTWQVFGDWPGSGFTCSWTNYDIYLSTSQNPPGSLSTTYTDNLGSDVVLVRSGPIAMSGAFFPGGALTPQVNPFGTILTFTTPYLYQGGELLLTIRHDGNDCGGNGSLDTVPSPFAQAIGVSSYTQADSWYSQGLITMKLEFTPPGDPGSSFCFTNPNSTGAAAVISATGSASVSVQSLSLVSASMPQNVNGIFYYGTNMTALPFGDGIRCVVGVIQRLPFTSSDANGVMLQPDVFSLAMPNLPIAPGTLFFQSWFRDPTGPGGTGFNLSDGLEIAFGP